MMFNICIETQKGLYNVVKGFNLPDGASLGFETPLGSFGGLLAIGIVDLLLYGEKPLLVEIRYIRAFLPLPKFGLKQSLFPLAVVVINDNMRLVN